MLAVGEAALRVVAEESKQKTKKVFGQLLFNQRMAVQPALHLEKPKR